MPKYTNIHTVLEALANCFKLNFVRYEVMLLTNILNLKIVKILPLLIKISKMLSRTIKLGKLHCF